MEGEGTELMETFHIEVEVPPIGKIPVFVRRWGGGPRKVLLIHGWMDSSRRWHRLAPYLASQYEVWALDLPGCGQTPRIPPCHTTLGTYAEVVARLSKLISEGEVLHGVVGHSMGGLLSLLLLKESCVTVQCIISCGPPIMGVSFLKSLANQTRLVAACLGMFQSFRSAVMKLSSERINLGIHGAPGLPVFNRKILPDAYADAPAAAILLKQICNYNLFVDLLEGLEEASHESPSASLQLQHSSVATLIMRGQHDPFCSRHASLQLARAIGSVFHEVPGALHVPFIERPSATYPVLRKFLNHSD